MPDITNHNLHAEPYLGVAEAAAYLKLHEVTLRRLVREGALPGVKIGRSWRFKISVLDAWANRGNGGPKASCRLLCLDDDPVVLRMLKLILADQPCEVLGVSTLVGAQALIDVSAPSAMLIDLQLEHGESGVELMRNNPKLVASIPVIIITAYPDSALLSEAMQLAPVTLLTKPIDPDQICSTVGRLIAAQQEAN